MRILIAGNGYVGSAVYALLSSRSYLGTPHQVETYDPDQTKSADYHRLEDIPQIEYDAVFICVNTPTSDGKCNPNHVWLALSQLSGLSPVLVVKSTLPPDIVGDIYSKYPDMAYEPEFLTQANALTDVMHDTPRVTGASSDHTIDTLCRIYKEGIRLTTPQAASAFKYAVNSFLALKVSYMNELHSVFTAAGIEWDTVRPLFNTDPRLGTTHFDVPGPDGQFGFGGACFPKDTEALIGFAETIGVDMGILKVAVERNRDRRTT